MHHDYCSLRHCQEGPAWRSKVVDELLVEHSDRLLQACDEHVRRLYDYRRLCLRGPAGQEEAKALYPSVAGAGDVNRDQAKTAQLKIAMLGGLDGAEMAERFALTEAILREWELAFFDVRSVPAEAVAWIHLQVVKPEKNAGREDLAARLKLVASVGAVAARAVLDADSRLPPGVGERLFDERLRLNLKFLAAADMPIRSNREKMFFIKAHAAILAREERLRLAQRRLEEQCQRAREKHELAKLRLEMARERAEVQGIVRGQKERERILKEEAERRLREQKASRLRDQRLAEAQAARARAEASPLASLKWESGNTARLDCDTVLVADLPHGDSTVTDTAEPSSLPFPMSPARREAVRVLGSNGRQKSEDESRPVPLTEPVAIPA